MDTALMVNALHSKGCKFLLTRNFKDLEDTKQAIRNHHKAVEEGTQPKVILMAIQHDVLPDYTILVCTNYHEFEWVIPKYGFHPVKKDRANWIPIQYRNRSGKEHHGGERGYDHTTNYSFLPLEEVHQYLKMAEKQEQINLIYK